MTDRVERFISLALAGAAVVIASSLAHREFFRDANAAQAVKPNSGLAVDATPVAEWKQVLGAARILGNPAARVTIAEFSDLECPFCAQFDETLRRVRDKYPNDVAFAFVHFPLPMHTFARPAATALSALVLRGNLILFSRRSTRNETQSGLEAGWNTPTTLELQTSALSSGV